MTILQYALISYHIGIYVDYSCHNNHKKCEKRSDGETFISKFSCKNVTVFRLNQVHFINCLCELAAVLYLRENGKII